MAGLLFLGVALQVRADDFPLKQTRAFTWVVDYEPCWSPDGKQIALISSRHGGMKVHVSDRRAKGKQGGSLP